MKKIIYLSTVCVLLLSNNCQVFARPNYVYTTTVEENYSASSPVGQFVNQSYQINNNMPVNNVISYVPYVNNTNPTPIYDATINYNMGDVNSNYSEQNISVPQSYHKTITTTENYIDTRENADKIIDRSSRVLGALSVVGAVVALFFWAI